MKLHFNTQFFILLTFLSLPPRLFLKKNMIAILIMSAKLAIPSLLKIDTS